MDGASQRGFEQSIRTSKIGMLLGDRLVVGLRTLTPSTGVRIPRPQPNNHKGPHSGPFCYLVRGDVDENPMFDSRGRAAASEDAKRPSLSYFFRECSIARKPCSEISPEPARSDTWLSNGGGLGATVLIRLTGVCCPIERE